MGQVAIGIPRLNPVTQRSPVALRRAILSRKHRRRGQRPIPTQSDALRRPSRSQVGGNRCERVGATRHKSRMRPMIIVRLTCALAAVGALITTSLAQAPRSPWPPGDELGMANTLGPTTWQRCATYLADPRAKSYELSHLRSNTMPQSPFGVLREAWDGKGEFPADGAGYYGGYTQADVKPTADSPLQKRGIEKVPAIITSAVLLDAKSHLGRGRAM